jgi:hypothetical protein
MLHPVVTSFLFYYSNQANDLLAVVVFLLIIATLLCLSKVCFLAQQWPRPILDP